MPLVEDYAPPVASVPDETTVLGAIAGCIAHEFNNLLAGMLLHIEAARECTLIPRESAAFLERAEREIRRAKRMTDELLALGKVSPLPIESIPAGILFPPDVLSHRQTVLHETETGGGNGWNVTGNRTQLELAFRNLERFLRASLPSAPVSPRIDLFTPSKNDPSGLAVGRHVRILLVSGDISGHAVREMPLDPFRPGTGEGTGLGLIMGYSVIKRHGGVIRLLLHEQAMVGLAVYLPLSSEGSDPNVKDESAARSRGRILLMDDEESIRSISEILFERLGYQITTVRDGAEAVKAFIEARESGAPYDVVILDLTIPGGMGGIETIQRLREIDGEVKAILSSGYLGDHTVEDYRALGFRESVDKPYRLETLTAAVERLIGTGR